MERIHSWCLIVALLLTINGCAYVVTNKADTTKEPNGIRAYAPRTVLFVGKTHSYVRTVPNLQDAYDIRPLSFLAKQNFNITMEDGVIKQADLNEDTTSIIPLIQKAAELASQAGKAAAADVIEDTFGLEPGVYELHTDGTIHRLSLTDLAGK